MRLNKQFFGRFSAAAALGAVWFIIDMLLRGRLAMFSHNQIMATPWEMIKVFTIGGIYDIAVIGQALLPLLIFLALVPRRFFAGAGNKVVVTGLIWLATAIILLLTVTEYYFWDEFQARFNFIAVDYLVYTQEVAGMISEGYPLKKLFIGIGLGASILTYIIRRKGICWNTTLSFKRRLGIVAATLLFPVIVFFSLSGNLKNVSSNIINNELAGNGIYEFLSAFRNNELDYVRYYKTISNDELMPELRQLLQEANSQYESNDPADFTKIITTAGPEKHPNIVFITVESLSSDYLGVFGNTKGLTPNLDKLAQESLFFTNVYATGTRTVRGLEALTLSIPPTPGQSIVRRPDNDDLFTLGSVLNSRNYKSWFIYGGYGYFDNMNDFYQKNNYQVLDRTSIPKEKIMTETIWGVADEVIFGEAVENLDQAYAKGEKVFQMIMTTSNHRPYIYPDGRIDKPSPNRDGAVKYTDWAIGNFLAEAKKHPWFNDTVFVIVADHQASSAGKTEVPIKKYHIPLFVYAPNLIAPGRVDRLMSQMDVAPTLLGLLNFSYTSKFMGYDIMKLPAGRERIFISTYQNIAYAKGDHLVILKPKNQVSFYQINYQTGEYQEQSPDPELLKEAITWYQGASMLYKEGKYHSLP
ncbi:LTA synthase family protein [Sporomusa acidovorans]|uniref:Phosphoglycerol transferase I n=1 Tax=Sporomusa acidovorans (strain ATCC 49682 / DSM 3132 / Mol) TaxID=1123286 RepID=A0ABZ3IY45_SPOA4|nr:LTA synthase family protein [Sporomusa acidovorans]OZC22330.1 lipoteichoic acid synthase 2 [Sporomusa acidovorans DSM 3132]SDE46000.1 Phosphoglycerol transferase MdoB [Sporomusa acidovorans]